MNRIAPTMPEDAPSATSAQAAGAARSAIVRGVLVGTGGIIALIIGLVAYTLWEMRHDAWVRAEQTSHYILRTVSGNIETHTRVLEFTMDVAANALKEAQDGELPPATRGFLTDVAAKAGPLSMLLVLDKDGIVRMDSRQEPPPPTNLSGRDYFSVHVGDPTSRDYVGTPVFAMRDNGEPTVFISRRVSGIDGAFLGVVVGGLRLGFVDDLFRSVHLGPEGDLLLASQAGIVFMRSGTAAAGTIGASIAASPVFRRMAEAGQGTFIASQGGMRRFFAFTRVGPSDMILSVAVAARDVFAEWWRRAAIIGSVSLVACAALCVFAFFLCRELGRRVAAEIRLAQLSMTDALTGLSNRRHFDFMLEREWRRAARTASRLALLFIDADNFKSLNDGFGHMHGDEVLKAVAESITASIRRPGDFVARFGGEEFAVILPDTDEVAAAAIAEVIRARVEDLHFGHLAPRVTVSIGVKAATPAPTLTMADLIEAADQALYRAKATGRNRVVVAS